MTNASITPGWAKRPSMIWLVLGVHGWTVVELVRVPGRNAVARTIVILTLVGCGLFLANILILALWLLGAIR